LWLAGIVCIAGSVGLAGALGGADSAVISGVVRDAGGPVEGATVRIQATTNSTSTAADGTFTLTGLESAVPVTLSAWEEGYYCTKQENVQPPAEGIVLVLRLYQTDDNPDFVWTLPISDDPSVLTCSRCKPGVTAIWLENDAHAGSGTNPRFFSMYNGTDATGSLPAAPGYAQDFPGTTGVCATCHAPGAAIDAPFSTSMNDLQGADLYGVHCDFCHKTAAVYLNPATGLPYSNAPGVLSMDVRRPWPGTDRYELFFGTFDDDNVPLEDTKLTLMSESQFCAPCHQFSFWGTPIYQSFREWQESAYAEIGVQCQICHMPAPSVLDGVVLTNVAPGMGGVERDPMTIHAHLSSGAASVALLQDTVELALDTDVGEGRFVTVEVAITNTKAGHHVPTDYPGRQMILVVTAFDDAGDALDLADGPVLPDWCGDQAGAAGIAYAKILRDVATGAFPVVNYWKQTQIESDNRIAAFETDRSVYRFAASPAAQNVTVRATVLFRRLFQDLADAKSWDMPDILMEETVISIPLGVATAHAGN
jgi:hypothetical protein